MSCHTYLYLCYIVLHYNVLVPIGVHWYVSTYLWICRFVYQHTIIRSTCAVHMNNNVLYQGALPEGIPTIQDTCINTLCMFDFRSLTFLYLLEVIISTNYTIDTLNFMEMKRTSIRNDIRRGVVHSLQRCNALKR